MKKHFAWGAAIMVAAVGASLVAALPAQVSYCNICGARQEARVCHLRFTTLTLFRHKETSATPFSQLMEEKHLAPAHNHEWQEPHLVPDPLDESAPQVIESVGYLNSPRIINFTRNVADYVDAESVARWKELIMRPQYPRVLDGALRFRRVPEEGFANREEFLRWWGGNSYAVYNRLREVTEPD